MRLPVRLLLGCLLLSGCAGGKAYTVKSLPQRWHARPTANVRTVGLTKLANDTTPIDQIVPGDVVEVSVAVGFSSDDSAQFAVRVNDDGRATIPDVGSVALAGLTLQEAEFAVRNACVQRKIYRNPHVAVTFKHRKMMQVVVVGGVEKEGTYMLPVGSAGLLQAISQAGGFTEEAGTNVEIRYPGRTVSESEKMIAQAAGTEGSGPPQVPGIDPASPIGRPLPVRTEGARTVQVNLATLSNGDSQDLRLSDGAVVMVERLDPPPLQVIGLVKEPQQVKFPVGKDVHLLDALAMAGGQNSLVADKVYVIRRRPEEPEPALIEVSMRQAKRNGAHNLLLEPGDTVSVEQTPATVLLEVIRTIGFNINAYAFR